MKKLKYLISFLSVIAIISSCTKAKNDDISFVKTATAPLDVASVFHITTDNSGLVTIIPNSAGAVSYEVNFGDTSTAPAKVVAGKTVMHKYAEGSYTVKIVSIGMTGLKTEASEPLIVTFRAPENLTVNTFASVHTLKASASALYAVGGFDAYFGDVANEAPVHFDADASVTHTYTNAGSYNLKVVALSGGAATTTFNQNITIYDSLKLPMTFEDPNVLYNWGDFGGNTTTVVPNPNKSGINTSATVGKMVKNGEVWAGNYIILDAPIDFSVMQKVKVKIYSPRVGMRIQLEFQKSSDASINASKELMTTVANQWEELTFDLTGQVDNSKLLQNMYFFIDNGTRGDGSANFTAYFDDITLTN